MKHSMYCLACDYDLHATPHNESGKVTCPECGRKCDPLNSKSYEPLNAYTRALRRWILVGFFIAIVIAGVFIFLVQYIK